MALRESLPTTRVRDLKGALAILVLEGRARKAKSFEVVVELPYVTDRTYQAAREFMQRVAPDVRFRLEGKDGTQAGAAKKGTAPRLRRREQRDATVRAMPSNELFTDLNRWLLKYLLIVAAPDRARSLRALATDAKVSLPTAQRFVEAFTTLGHLVKSDAGYIVVRKHELMRRWLGVEESIRDVRLPVRSLYGAERLMKKLALLTSTHPGEMHAALGGFGACEARGVLHVVDKGLPEVHVDSRAMEHVRGFARACERHEADFFVIPAATFGASIFRPLFVANADHGNDAELRPVDLVQCALDVCKLPSGNEQARYIIDDVLGWRDGD